MATASAPSDSSEVECPVCHEAFDEPKMLPCTHLVCSKCLLSWLSKAGAGGGCPLCRAPVLTPSRRGQGQGDLQAEVKRLPTDLATMAVVESQRVLSTPHVCHMCHDSPAADSYCFQCAVKLCKTCTDYHKKLPATKAHTLEELHKLTVSQLVASQRVSCKSHPDRSAELYCPAHCEVICILCGTTEHGSCSDKKTIDAVAAEKRAELEQETRSLRDREAELSTQINEVKDKFKVMRTRAHETFDDLEQCLRSRRRALDQQIQAEEDAAMTSVAELEKWRAALTLNASSVDQLLGSASGSAVLAMARDLQSRLADLKAQSGTVGRVQVADLTLDGQELNQLKTDIASFGQQLKSQPRRVTTPLEPVVRTSAQSTSTSVTPPQELLVGEWARSTSSSVTPQQRTEKPRRAELAKVLRVGDRVKPGPGLLRRRGQPGTVTAIPSQRRARWAADPTGWVDVKWDGGRECAYRMGYQNKYDLDLV